MSGRLEPGFTELYRVFVVRTVAATTDRTYLRVFFVRSNRAAFIRAHKRLFIEFYGLSSQLEKA